MQTYHLLEKSFDITHAVIGRKSVLYQSTKHGAELKLSDHLPIFTIPDHFPDFSLAFFHSLKVKIRNK